MRPFVEELSRICKFRVGVYPNAGLPNAMGEYDQSPGEFSGIMKEFAYAVELIESIRALNGFCIGAAGYPEGHVENPDKEANPRHQKAKVDAGAELLVS